MLLGVEGRPQLRNLHVASIEIRGGLSNGFGLPIVERTHARALRLLVHLSGVVGAKGGEQITG